MINGLWVDEAFEAVTLVQTGKIRQFPIVFVDTVFWAPLRAMVDSLVAGGTVTTTDAALIMFTDDPVEAAALISGAAQSRFGLRQGPPPHIRRRWWLREQ